MIHPNTMIKFINDEMGYGIFATQPISKGTMTYVQDGLETQIFPKFFNQLSLPMQEQVEKYAFVDRRGVHIVSWDLAKYVNHSCSANSMSTGYGFEIALRDIQPGEQLTDEYGLFNLSKEMPCTCGAINCRGSIKPTDVDVFHRDWDRKIRLGLRNFFHVDQPLLWLLDHQTIEQLMEYSKKSLSYKSVLALKRNQTNSAKAA